MNPVSSEPHLEPLGMGLDSRAEVFVSGEKVLRAIRSPHEDFYSELLRQPFIERSMADGILISTKVSDTKIEGYSLVLEHPRICPVTLPFEWPAEMMRAAALCILELNDRLMQHGYCTVDGHPWNILFEGVLPRFIDFTSIIRLPTHGLWEEMKEFSDTFLSALQLMEKGYPTVARALSREVRSGPDRTLASSVPYNARRIQALRPGMREITTVMDFGKFFIEKGLRRLRWKMRGRVGFEAKREDIAETADEIRAMNLLPAHDMWSTYYNGAADAGVYDGSRQSLENLSKTSPKHRVISELLDRWKPRSVLDVACNRGPYSQIAALKGARAIGIDTDEAALDAMYRDSVALGSGAIPLYTNPVTPAEAIAFHERPFPSVIDRLRSECVLCLALVHHLVFRQHRINFRQVAHILASLSEKHLVVEFVPVNDRALKEFLDTRSEDFRRRYEWYTLANFKAALGKYFATVEELPSFPETRVILACTRA